MFSLKVLKKVRRRVEGVGRRWDAPEGVPRILRVYCLFGLYSCEGAGWKY